MIEDGSINVGDDGFGVGVGGVDDGDIPRLASVEVDIVEADAGPADNAQARRFGEESFVDIGVGSDDKGVGDRELCVETAIVRATVDDFGVFAQPCDGFGGQGFGD